MRLFNTHKLVTLVSLVRHVIKMQLKAVTNKLEVNERKEMWCCLRDMQNGNGNGKKICLFCFNYQCWAVCFIDSIFIEYPLLYLWDWVMLMAFILSWALRWYWEGRLIEHLLDKLEMLWNFKLQCWDWI